MKNFTKPSFLILFLSIVFQIALFAQSYPIEIEISKKDLKLSKANLSAVASEIKHIPLETRPDCIFNLAKGYRVKMAGNNFLISSKLGGKAFVFGPDGKFLCRIGKRGKGPGEYTSFYKVSWDKEINRFLMLLSQNKLNIYLPDGQFERQIEIDIPQEVKRMLIGEDEWVFYWLAGSEGDKCNLGLTYTDRDMKIIKSRNIDFPSEYQSAISRWNWNPIYLEKGNVVCGISQPYKLYELKDKLDWVQRLSITLPIKKIPKDIYPDRSKIQAQNEFMGRYGFLYGVGEYDKYLILSLFDPAKKDLLVNKSNGQVLNISYNVANKKAAGFIDDLTGGPPFKPQTESGNTWVGMSTALSFCELEKNPIKDLDINNNPVVSVISLK